MRKIIKRLIVNILFVVNNINILAKRTIVHILKHCLVLLSEVKYNYRNIL